MLFGDRHLVLEKIKKRERNFNFSDRGILDLQVSVRSTLERLMEMKISIAMLLSR